ncbi:pentapeptide repeat-containing protein [Candidatus Colwellia aromaticivorans]|uniref:pentapeptide repeat-containing protein n=1 Tax=Candidatus Colwellia aromaticivorans TaxID=2267621 RepID=UPI000DF18D2C|nr:pentapeptide repeat-containing protein [Candidatus Colwellia aromaticivorans]
MAKHTKIRCVRDSVEKVLFFLCCMMMLVPNSLAQEQLKRGANGTLDKEAFFSLLEDNKPIKNFVIDGHDIATAIRETNHAIRIENSIILNGLDLDTKADRISMKRASQIIPPGNLADWSEKMNSQNTKQFYLVNNLISIKGSEIQASKLLRVNTKYGIWAKDVIFVHPPSFEGTTINGRTNFHRVTFSSKDVDRGNSAISGISFSGAIFIEGGTFKDAVFLGRANFSNSKFRGKMRFDKAAFHKGANFYGVSFEKDVHFLSLTLGRRRLAGGNISFEKATFYGKAVFSKSIFRFDALFLRATFIEDLEFTKVQAEKEVNFRGATFHYTAMFQDSSFTKAINFHSANFLSHSNFTNNTFFEKPIFTKTKFAREAIFLDATFCEGGDFRSAEFNDDVSFKNTFFQSAPTLQRAVFKKNLYFRSARIFGTLDLGAVELPKYTSFRDAEINVLNVYNQQRPIVITGRLDFRNAHVRHTKFEDVIVMKNIDFSGAELGTAREEEKLGTSTGELTPCKTVKNIETKEIENKTILRLVTFQDIASFHRTRFMGSTVFDNVTFQDEANLTDALFDKTQKNEEPKFTFSYVKFNDLRLSFATLPLPSYWTTGNNLEPRSSVLKRLETNFRRLQQLSDANEAYFYMKQSELSELENKEFSVWLGTHAERWFWGFTSGYGTKMSRVLMWSLSVLIFFTLVYASSGTLARKQPHENKPDFTFRLRLLDFPKAYVGNHIIAVDEGETAKSPDNHNSLNERLWNGFRFSFVILFKVGYRDTTVAGRFLGLDLKYLVILEWLLGYLLLAALTITLAETQPLVHRLLYGLF